MVLSSQPWMPPDDRRRLPRNPALPTMYDLPSEDPEEPGLPDIFHDLQPQMLSRTLQGLAYERDNYFVASDLNVYYDPDYPLWHKRPDWFLAIDVPNLYDGWDLRLSYVVWQEGRSPHVVVEFLSPGTGREDLGRFYDAVARAVDEQDEDYDPDADPDADPDVDESSPESSAEAASLRLVRPKPPGKLTVYESILRIPHYIVYSRYTQQLRYFKLVGDRYQEQVLSPDNPRIWLDDLNIGLGIWQGKFENSRGHWLRWCDRDGNWFLTDTEQAQQEAAQARQEAAQAQHAATQAQHAAAQAQYAAAQAQRAAEQIQQTADRIQREAAQAQHAVEQAQQEAAQAQQEAAQAQRSVDQIQQQLRQAARNLLATGMAIAQVAQVLGLSETEIQVLNSENPESPTLE